MKSFLSEGVFYKTSTSNDGFLTSASALNLGVPQGSGYPLLRFTFLKEKKLQGNRFYP